MTLEQFKKNFSEGIEDINDWHIEEEYLHLVDFDKIEFCYYCSITGLSFRQMATRSILSLSEQLETVLRMLEHELANIDKRERAFKFVCEDDDGALETAKIKAFQILQGEGTFAYAWKMKAKGLLAIIESRERKNLT